MTEEKTNLFKEFKAEYKATAKPAVVECSPAQYLLIEGKGEPGGPEFEEAIGALYGMAFTIKMTRKAAGLGDYVVCKLESLWPGDFCEKPVAWTLMIRTPDCVGQGDLDMAVAALLSKGKCVEVKQVRLEQLDEGSCVQMMHVGPYDKIGDTVIKLEAFAKEQNLTFNGFHHEIFVSDPRRIEPERLKTIIRQPVC